MDTVVNQTCHSTNRGSFLSMYNIVLLSLRRDLKSLNLSKTRSLRQAQVKTRVLDGLEFSKNQPSWRFLSLRLESSAADDRKFHLLYWYI